MSSINRENEIIAVIPARAGSKRITGKNTREFAGKPLIAYSIEAAQKANIFSKIIVSTDSDEIAGIARTYGALIPFIRPIELADDFCPVGEVIQHAIGFLEKQGSIVDYACGIFATAPMVSAKDLVRGLEGLKSDMQYSSALAITAFEFPIQRALKLNEHGGLTMIHPEHRLTRSQDLENCYHDAGQFFWINNIGDKQKRTKGIKPVIIDRFRVQDIDTPEDWKIAEYQFKAMELMRNQSGGIE